MFEAYYSRKNTQITTFQNGRDVNPKTYTCRGRKILPRLFKFIQNVNIYQANRYIRSNHNKTNEASFHFPSFSNTISFNLNNIKSE